MALRSMFLVAVLLVTQVAAHGYVPWIVINGTRIAGWDVNTDGYTTPQPVRIVRATKPDSGFIADPTSKEITCSVGNAKLPPAPITAVVAAGSTVTAQWNSWPVGHFGPVINYMAKCPSTGCSSWKGDTGTPWFKINQAAYVNGEWASDTLAKNGAAYKIPIPKNIPNGEYLIRHENLALHGGTQLGGAQFYPVCIQITVVGGTGAINPSGLAFPGAYKATDPGILFSPYQGEAANKAYVPPGGPVYSGLQF